LHWVTLPVGFLVLGALVVAGTAVVDGALVVAGAAVVTGAGAAVVAGASVGASVSIGSWVAGSSVYSSLNKSTGNPSSNCAKTVVENNTTSRTNFISAASLVNDKIKNSTALFHLSV